MSNIKAKTILRPIRPKIPQGPKKTLDKYIYIAEDLCTLSLQDIMDMVTEARFPLDEVQISGGWNEDTGNTIDVYHIKKTPNPDYKDQLSLYKADMKIYQAKKDIYDEKIESYNKELRNKERLRLLAEIDRIDSLGS